jgi:hypothetical protein
MWTIAQRGFGARRTGAWRDRNAYSPTGCSGAPDQHLQGSGIALA